MNKFITNNRGRKKKINLYNLNYSLKTSKKVGLLGLIFKLSLFAQKKDNCPGLIRHAEIAENLVIVWVYEDYETKLKKLIILYF